MKSFYKIVATLSLLPLRRLGGFLLWLLPLWLSAQSSTQNYVVSTVPYQVVSDPSSLTDANSNTTVQYFDGLGRLMETVQRAITPSGSDVVSAIEYDAFGRDYRHWLPGAVAGNSGAYVRGFASYATGINGGDANPYATTEYEPSPLKRVTGQYGAGADWYNNGKKKIVAYTTNGADVKHYYTDGTQLKCDGNYTAAMLYGQKTTDEDGKTVEEFTDKLGRKVLSRVAGDHDTYYVYDDMDNLRYVLPPMTADALGTNISGFGEGAGTPLDQYGYIYHYDGRKRCTEKKLPGTDWIYMVYDLADRLILSQDGNQRLKPTKQWTANKYDAFDRALYTGLINSNDSRATMESNYSGSVTNESYTGSGPVAGYTSANLTPSIVLTVNYYDNYGFLSYSGNNPNGILNNTNLSGYTNPDLSYTKTLLTGTRVYHLDNPSLFEVTALYYDKYARVVQTRSTNHLGGYDLVYNELKFTGVPARTYKTHGINGASATITELYTYDYDKAQRPTTTTYSLNGGDAVTLASNTYDELGRLSSKNLGEVDATTYSYNVRSWTTGISGSRFSENLYYNANTVGLPNFTPVYNGNIAGMQWNVANESDNRAYSFAYDGLNRLTDASYSGFNGGVIGGTQNRYDEHFGFDKMGNTTTFTRNGLLSSSGGYGTIDNLTFTYNGNQKVKIIDAGTNGIFYGNEEFVQNTVNSGNSCAYDANGNRLYDSNSNIWGIRYNTLNLPDAMQFYQGHQTNYTYSASGAKLKVVDKTAPAGVILPVTSLNTILSNPSVSSVTTTDYVGNMIYENGSLKRILTSVGYWQAGTYYYFLKDHLGSNRVVINGSGSIAETSSYYPSGMRFGESAVNGGSVQPYRHTGHEMQEMHGLNWIDNLARFRTISDGSGFTGVDPLAEKYYSISPYAYCAGNPINALDPNGMDVYILNTKGQYILALKTEDNHDNLYALDKSGHLAKTKDGTLKRQTVSDKTIMSSLKWKKGNDSNSSVTSNATDAFNVFKFSADNSENEWSLSGFKDHGKTKFFLNTEYDNSGASTGEGSVFQAKDMLFNLHDHPSEEGAKGGSGYNIEPQLTSNGNWKYVLKSRDIPSDAYTSKALYDNTGRVMPMYVYYPHSNELYKYTPWNGNNRTWSNVNSVMILQRIIYPK